MRKLIVHTLASLDGVVDNPPSWGSRDYKEDESFRDDLGEVLACDAMLLGRGGYESLQAIFATRTDPWAARINAMNKFVFSSTLRETTWTNARRVEDANQIERMKREDGSDLLIYGFTRFAESLFRKGLVDVLRVSIHPVFAGYGRGLFCEGLSAKMKLVSSKTYSKGVVLVTYVTHDSASA
jgi:dihydrofolate reductase